MSFQKTEVFSPRRIWKGIFIAAEADITPFRMKVFSPYFCVNFEGVLSIIISLFPRYFIIHFVKVKSSRETFNFWRSHPIMNKVVELGSMKRAPGGSRKDAANFISVFWKQKWNTFYERIRTSWHMTSTRAEPSIEPVWTAPPERTGTLEHHFIKTALNTLLRNLRRAEVWHWKTVWTF